VPIAGGRVSPNNRWGLTTGQWAGQRPIGWMLVVHGGAWVIVGPLAVAETDSEAAFFRANGWAAYQVDYRAGRRSLADVIAAYDRMRARIPRAAPVCAWGASAGGNLVLLLAARRPSLRCVIAEAGPTDLVTLGREKAWAAPGANPYTRPRVLQTRYAVPLFGAAHLAAFSPVDLASRIRARLLLGASALDPLVPLAQMHEMQRALPRRTRVMILAGMAGTPVNFTHASVTAAALGAWQRAQLRLMAETAAAR
jgi:dipeptidyl aminopeptidase/acylaminoacyl peptidase